MILSRLRENTRPYHDRLETRLDLLSCMGSIAGYRAVLTRFYGFYVPLEPLLASRIQQNAPEFDYARRRKAVSLTADLATLGISATEIGGLPLCMELPSLPSLSRSLGCLYVLEGATLGGQIIARHLRTVLGLDERDGARFFHGYGSDTGRMWRAYGEHLTGYVAEYGDEDDIIAAACDTFARFEAWLCTGDLCS